MLPGRWRWVCGGEPIIAGAKDRGKPECLQGEGKRHSISCSARISCDREKQIGEGCSLNYSAPLNRTRQGRRKPPQSRVGCHIAWGRGGYVSSHRDVRAVARTRSPEIPAFTWTSVYVWPGGGGVACAVCGTLHQSQPQLAPGRLTLQHHGELSLIRQGSS